ncbi:MAG TPA: hypothetical protein VJB13_01610 [Candidatus Nanoarchaeia archaeon]|nr:hypothetical protein [Candidatus Nanoarchaeia archaeon]
MQKRAIWMGLVLITVLFLLSCQPAAPTTETQETEKTEVSAEECTAQWECADENYKVYVQEDCVRKDATECERGCVNGECRSAEACTTGFKCIDDFRRGYQKEDCSFISKIDCEWGCDAGKCQDKPTNIFTNSTAPPTENKSTYSAIAENSDEPVEEKKTIYTLKVNEQQQLDIKGVPTNISIHFLEPSQVTLKVNGIKSNPIPEQGNTTYENIGATFKIEWILFQSYAGGKQEIGFSIK